MFRIILFRSLQQLKARRQKELAHLQTTKALCCKCFAQKIMSSEPHLRKLRVTIYKVRTALDV